MLTTPASTHQSPASPNRTTSPPPPRPHTDRGEITAVETREPYVLRQATSDGAGAADQPASSDVAKAVGPSADVAQKRIGALVPRPLSPLGTGIGAAFDAVDHWSRRRLDQPRRTSEDPRTCERAPRNA